MRVPVRQVMMKFVARFGHSLMRILHHRHHLAGLLVQVLAAAAVVTAARPVSLLLQSGRQLTFLVVQSFAHLVRSELALLSVRRGLRLADNWSECIEWILIIGTQNCDSVTGTARRLRNTNIVGLRPAEFGQ